ncbi:MAG: cation diffusion facilitator family transporter [Clostridium perfringens]|nr:cation diffusion facilitator family transporter [Clostridium perfringens]
MGNRYTDSTKVTILSIILNIILTILKVISGIFGKSSAIIADGIHSASDILTSIGVLIGNHFSKKPKDLEHPYGHERIETIVSFILSSVLIFVSIKIGVDGVTSLLNPESIVIPTLLPLVISFISILIKEFQFRITIRIANKTNSPSLKADAWHHRSDALSSIAAFIGIGGAMFGIKILDPIASIIVALIVVKVGFDIFNSSFNDLIDRSIDGNDIKEIKILTLNHPDIFSIKSFKSRRHGAFAYIDITITLDKNLTLLTAHKIADDLEKEIISKFKYIKEINIHTEPYN